MTTALVTGSTGFSGRCLVELLIRQGLRVHRVSGRTDISDVERVDLADSRALAQLLDRMRPDYIFHLSGAALADDLAPLVRVNCLHAATLLDAMSLAGLDDRPVLMVGSAAEYGPLRDGDLPAREDGPTRPTSPYGITKLAQTQLALGRARQGFRVTVARPSNIVGPDMPTTLALASFARQLAEVEAGLRAPMLNVGNLNMVRDFIDVADVVKAYWKLINAPDAFGQVVNVARGVGTRLDDALAELQAVFGLHVPVEQSEPLGGSRDVPAFYACTERLDSLIGEHELLPLSSTLASLAAHARSAVGILKVSGVP